jgi:hypothetical protein
VMNTLSLPQLRIRVTVLPPIQAHAFATREELATFLHRQISQCYNLQAF